jgi:hypothetical protein
LYEERHAREIRRVVLPEQTGAPANNLVFREGVVRAVDKLDAANVKRSNKAHWQSVNFTR